MKLAVATSFALAAPILAAYTSADIPSCANTCFEDGAPKVGCSVTDQACLCENQSDLTNEITSCVTTSCSISDALKTQQVSSGICEDLSSSSSSASSTAAATSTGSVSVFITIPSSSSTAAETGTNSASASDSSSSSSAETVAVTLTGTLVSSGTNTATIIPIVFNTTTVPSNGTLTSITTPMTPAANSTASSTSTRTTSADSSTSSDSDTSTASATSSGEAASASSTAGASSFNEHGGFMASFVMMVVGVMMF